MDTVTFRDIKGRPGVVSGELGTNFGLRITAEEVMRLFGGHTWDLPFEVMAAGYGEDEDWVALMYEDVDGDSFATDASFEDLEREWGPFELTVGPIRDPNAEDIAAANIRGYYMAGGDFDYDNITFTPDEALDNLASFIDIFRGDGEPRRKAELDKAIDTLHAFIKQVNEHGSTDLEWGEPGSCVERIANDGDIIEALGFDSHGSAFQMAGMNRIREIAIEKGLGRHYGDPHCIWCLQAS